MSGAGGGWPYADLRLCTPHCPLCGVPAEMLVGTNVHPMAWCTADGCAAFTWDPSVPAARLLAEAKTMVEHTDGSGRTVYRPQ